jgi:hypothetical protein
MTHKEYVIKELQLTPEQLERVADLFEMHKVAPKMPDLAPMTSFSIEYQFSTIGVAKVMHIGDKEIIINEEDMDNL